MMNEIDHLQVLFLEDMEKDVEIVHQKLMDDLACPVYLDSTATEEAYLNLIKTNTYDVILADYTLPGYNAWAALKAARSLCPETPFICVSGTVGEENAVEMLKQGATDYVLKDRPNRLTFAILRALESSQREKDKKRIKDYFVNMSHELKTPLSIQMISLDMMNLYLKGESFDKDQLLQCMETIRQNTFRLSRLVGNLLDITRLDAGFMAPNLANIDIVRLLCGLTKSMRCYTAAKGLNISFSSTAASQCVRTDPQLIERIMLNLISNAIKHTPRGGNIHIQYEEKQDKFVISVIDNGEGIPDDQQEIIFERFRQVDTAFTRANGGSGIGLNLVKAFAEILGGRITLKSKLNVGSTFSLELPLVSADEHLPAQDDHQAEMNLRVQIELSDIQLI